MLFIRKPIQPGLTITADENLIDEIITETENNNLVIKNQEGISVSISIRDL